MSYQIPNKKPNEKILLLLRRHWLYFAAPVASISVLLLIPVIFFSVASFVLPAILVAPYLTAALFVTSIYLLFIWLFFFIIWTDYYLDVWIVTDERIIDIEQIGLFNREVSEFNLERIQDVTIEIKGVLPTFFNFGNVHIQTASEAHQFIFKQVHRPHEIKNTILKLHTQAREKQLNINS